MNDSKEIGELLISKGADINAKDSYNKTPIFLAAENNKKTMFTLLASKGADVYAKNIFGSRPLHCAAEKNYKEIFEALQLPKDDFNVQGSNSSNQKEERINSKGNENAKEKDKKGKTLFNYF